MTTLVHDCVAATLALMLLSTGVCAAEPNIRPASCQLAIPAEDLQTALQAFALACHQKLLYRAELVAGKISHAMNGSFTTEEAVRKLLDGTGLEFDVTSAAVVLIRGKGEGGLKNVAR
jgi:hemoglobin/transferrin/lactoferrin receptor protein